MSKEVTYIFDKYNNDVDLFRVDRTDNNHLAIGTIDSIAEFVKLLSKHIEYMDNNKTLYVSIKEIEL